jgi:hypothetical protein
MAHSNVPPLGDTSDVQAVRSEKGARSVSFAFGFRRQHFSWRISTEGPL